MPRIEDTLVQDEIANSLLGDIQEQPENDAIDNGEYSDFGGLSSSEQEIGNSLVGGEGPRVLEEVDEPTLDDQPEFADESQFAEGEAQPQEGQEPEAQPVEPTHQSIQSALEATNAFVEERQLVDIGEATALASEFGVPTENAAQVGNTMAALTITGIQLLDQAGWQFENLQPLHPLQCQAIHDHVVSMLGMDPRLSQANPQEFAADVMFGMVNFLTSVDRYGVNATLRQINSPQASEWFTSRLLHHLEGSNQPVSREVALRAVDTLTRLPLKIVQKLYSQMQEQQPTRSSRTRSSGAKSKSNTKLPWASHQDLFDAETLDFYRQQHSRY